MSIFNNILPIPHSPFMAGLIVGGTDGFPSDVLEEFKRTGASHIVAVSGSNVAIVVTACVMLLTAVAMRRKYQFWVITLGLIVFTMITGFQGSIVRAVLMGWIMVLAQSLGRVNNTRNAIVYAGILLVCINPFMLRYDVGFQLSFMATLGLVYGLKIIKPITASRPKIHEYLMPTCLAYIWTLPITLTTFQSVSLISPLVNLIIAPLIPLGMLAGVIILLTFWIPGVSYISQFFGYIVLEIILKVVAWGSGFEWGYVQEVTGWWVLPLSGMIYSINSILWRFHKKRSIRALQLRLESRVS